MSPNRTVDTLDEASLKGLLFELGQEAMQRRFEVAPNPCVGAALIRGEEVVTRGFHERWAGPHAEVLAVAAAQALGDPGGRWDTLVCTLEPCSTEGKTPACTAALVEAGVRRVIVGALDPDVRHRGKGLELLAEMGVEANVLAGGSPLEVVAPHFLRWNDPDRVRRARPWLIAKWAQTRTGQLIPPEDVGAGRWISSPRSLAEVQVLRGAVDAIVTGVGTVLADDPRLTLRPAGDGATPPLRVVLDTELRTSTSARLFAPQPEGEAGGEVWILCRAGASPRRHREFEALGARVIGLRPGTAGKVSLQDALTELWQRDVRRVLVEAGPTLLTALFERGMVDQVAVYSGDVNGGRGTSLAERLRPSVLSQPTVRDVGDDSVMEAFYTP